MQRMSGWITAEVGVRSFSFKLLHVTRQKKLLILFVGVAFAIAKAAGPEMVRSCKEYIRQNGLLSTTQVAATKPGDLDARMVAV